MQQTSIFGQKIAYVRQGAGQVLVMLHGLGADSSQCIGPFGDIKGVDLICPDMPGHGQSPPSAFSFENFVEIIAGLLDQLGVEKAIVGGISMGASLSLKLALDYPELVEGLVLVRPAWIDRRALPQLSLVARVGRWLEAAPETAAARLEADAEFIAIARTNPAAAQSIRGLFSRPQAEVSAAVLNAMVHDRPFANLHDLAHIACPALVIANEGDPLHPVAVAQDIFAHLPEARYALLPSRYLEQAQHFSALKGEIDAFLGLTGDQYVYRAHHDRSHPRQAQGQG